MSFWKRAKRFGKKVVQVSAVAVGSVIGFGHDMVFDTVDAYAQASTDLGVDTDAMLTGAATDIGGYVGWGIGLAIAVIAIWKVKKYVSKAG